MTRQTAPVLVEYRRITSDGRDTYLATFSNWSDAQAEMRRSARDHASILELEPPEFAADGKSVTIWIDRQCGTYERYVLTQVQELYRYPRF